MSRSYKKAIFQIAPVGGKIGKKFANRKVRRTENIPSGMGYKKVYCSYKIHDWVSDSRWGSGWWLPRGSKKTGAGWIVPK